jgi:nitrogen regulatory protein P-II 1
MGIQRIEAMIRPERLEPLRTLLDQHGYPGMTITEIQGHGKQRGTEQQWRGTRFQTYFLPKIKIELVVPEKSAKKIVDCILEVCGNGQVGDGKIFISDVREVIRIRTKERGNKAL